MTTLHVPMPTEDAIEATYEHIKESFVLAITGELVDTDLDAPEIARIVNRITMTVDDAVGNNFDVLTALFGEAE